VLASRADPPLPLARLRARGQLTELREADLRFTAEETAALLKAATGLKLPADSVAALAARTEGWVAGLQLAADTYGGAVAHANIQEPRRKRPWDKGRPWLCDSEGPGS
jgi:ATP/maltotriose-dependent transcriptional regulator MalT